MKNSMQAFTQDRQLLYESIQAFAPFNEQEAADKEIILQALQNDPCVFA